jgi:colanic acid/amylovoran biosynthesis protein
MRIVVTHMSTDGNRGDFAILAATVAKLRGLYCNADISAISVERGRTFSQEDIQLTEALDVEIIGTLEPPLSVEQSMPAWIVGVALAELALCAFRLIGKPALRFMPERVRHFFVAFMRADLVFGKGGSYLYAYKGWRQSLYLWRMLYPLRAAIAAGKPPVLLGVSLGPFTSRWARHSARRVTRACSFVYVREEISRDTAVEMLELPEQRVAVVPDMAFSLPSPPHRRERTGVAITVRDLPFRDAEDADSKRLAYRDAVVATVIDLLERHPSEEVTFVPQASHDAELAWLISRAVGRPDRTVVLDREFTLENLVETYAGFRFVIATRLHSLILSAVASTPAIHIAYEREKGVGIMRMLGLESWVIDASALDGDRLVELVQSFEASLDDVDRQLRFRLEELREEIDATFAALGRVTQCASFEG